LRHAEAHVGALDIIALALGVLVAATIASVASAPAAQRVRDKDMIWEGRVAAGMAALIPVGLLWTGQAVVTLFATLADGGFRPLSLWVWLLAAPALGASPPAAALVRKLQRTSRNGSPSSDLHGRVAAVQQAANFAWADTVAESGWDLRRTPPLPIHWPPPPNGSAVWLCFAESASTAESIELAGPWARITLTANTAEAPAVERLSDAVTPIGWQQTAASAVDESPVPQAALVDAIRRGDPDGILARTLDEWRARNALIAAQPTVASHLPPAD
jgi:hypothetical protein